MFDYNFAEVCFQPNFPFSEMALFADWESSDPISRKA